MLVELPQVLLAWNQLKSVLELLGRLQADRHVRALLLHGLSRGLLLTRIQIDNLLYGLRRDVRVAVHGWRLHRNAHDDLRDLLLALHYRYFEGPVGEADFRPYIGQQLRG